ncbi:MAG: transposase [Coprobacillus sp.]
MMKNINLLILCYLHDLGHSLFECPNCDNFTFVWHTCKSRFCNKCGIKYQKIRSNAVMQKVFDVPHRHGVFTVPPDLREFFLKDRSLLNLLFDSVNDTLSFVIGNAGSKKDSLIPCAVLTLHTFGRGLNWIPHIHVLLAEGGVRKDGSFKHLKHINYTSLRKSFQKCLLDRLDAHFDSIDFKQLKRRLYREYPDGFYAYCPPSKHKTLQDCVDYVVRYVGRPVMASSRIDDYDYDLNHVIWHYTDHETNQRVDEYDRILPFMKKLIIHIPDENFKMIRYIGGYATKKKKLCKLIKKMVGKSHAWILKDKVRYRRFLIDTTGVDPLKCSCGHEMQFVDAFFPGGLEEQINARWKLFDWKNECDPLQVY